MNDIVLQPVPNKQCTKCKQEFPATREFFYVNKAYKDGLLKRCKTCCLQSQPRPQLPEGYKRCSRCKQDKPATLEYFQCEKRHKDGLVSRCKVCCSELKRVRYERDREQILVRQRELHRINPEPKRERARNEYYANRQQSRERMLRYRSRPEIKEYLRQSNAARRQNPEIREKEKERLLQYSRTPQSKAQHLRYQRNHPDKMREYRQRRRAIKRTATGTHTAQDIQAQYKRQKGKCYYCQCKLASDYHVDHIVPLTRGGSNNPENLVIACRRCNTSKKNRLPHEWFNGGRLL